MWPSILQPDSHYRRCPLAKTRRVRVDIVLHHLGLVPLSTPGLAGQRPQVVASAGVKVFLR